VSPARRPSKSRKRRAAPRALAKYREMRDFGKTPEPRGARPRRGGDAFVVQKHAATRLHYDFRLEMDGVLKSWAVPKGPSLDPKERRLAVHVEDHPVEYGGFEGVIPKGEYGGGPVLLWDRGRWTPKGDAREGYRKGHLSFRLEGEKLHGDWSLVRMDGRDERGKENWLLLKADDDAARRGPEAEVVERRPESVESGRTIEDVRAAQDRVWHSGRPAGRAARPEVLAPATRARKTSATRPARSPRVDPSTVAGARRAGVPRTLSPALATLVSHAPPGDGWVHEIKFDGYRLLVFASPDGARLRTRRGKDWTAAFPTLARAATALPVERAVLDGELALLDEHGKSSFQGFQNAMSEGREEDLTFHAFDLLHLDGWDLRGATLLDRKRVLRSLVERAGPGPILFSDHVVGRGPDVHAQACAMGLEGIVSKRADAPYVSGRGRDWLKVKCVRGQEFVIGGFTPPEGARTGIGALLVGVHEDGRLRYAGKVGTGFTEATLEDLRARLSALARPDPPFSDPPRGAPVRGVTWVEPTLVGEVRFAEWTRDGRLRHPSFQGLREDKPAASVVRERADEPPRRERDGDEGSEETPMARTRGKAAKPTTKGPSRARTARERSARAPAAGGKAPVPASPARAVPETVVAGVRLTNPDRVLYPKDGLTKADVARYYESVGEAVLRFVDGRPLTLVRCPEGHEGECFYQKHGNPGTPAAVSRIDVPERGGKAQYLMASSVEAIVSLVQMGVLELHVWGSTVSRLEEPDLIVMDLDPDPAVPWAWMVEAALLVRERLEAYDLEPFVKTTGGKGLHVVAPLRPKAGWDEVKAFTKSVADGLARDVPDRYLAVMSKAKRKGKIFVDYLRNGRGATAVAPYSTRARAGAPVATPIAWDELGPGVEPARRPFHVGNVPARVAGKDPWRGFEAARRPLTAKALRAAGVRG
jgi:bifunctional non-homologous end joining protein LigD